MALFGDPNRICLDKKLFWALLKCPKVAILPKNYDIVLWLPSSLGRSKYQILERRIFWALMKCPKVAILPKSYDIVLWLEALLGNLNRKCLDRRVFWALMKCPKVLKNDMTKMIDNFAKKNNRDCFFFLICFLIDNWTSH